MKVKMERRGEEEKEKKINYLFNIVSQWMSFVWEDPNIQLKEIFILKILPAQFPDLNYLKLYDFNSCMEKQVN